MHVSRHPFISILFSLLLLAIPVTHVAAQSTTFNVTVETKSGSHPNAGQGHPAAFVIDGMEANEITLVRGVTYTFQMQNTPSVHPFYLSTSSSGAGAQPFTDGVSGNNATGNATLTFTPNANTPDDLFYQCAIHQFMGWRINIVDTSTDTEEDAEVPESFAVRGNYPNPFNPVTTIRFDLPATATVSGTVFDVSGRAVMQVSPHVVSAGRARSLTLDASALPTGLYTYGLEAISGGVTYTDTGQMLLVK